MGVKWGPDAGITGRVSEEALELAVVNSSIEKAGKAENHTGVDRGSLWGGEGWGQNQIQACGFPDSRPHQGLMGAFGLDPVACLPDVGCPLIPTWPIAAHTSPTP